jgi:hypothetical protein
MNELERDVRILRRGISKGFVSPQQIDKLLVDLPDVSERAQWIDTDALGGAERPQDTDALGGAERPQDSPADD